MNKEFHPAANFFPLLEGDGFAALCADIAEHGQREAIWLHPDGRILDGRNRYRACEQLGLAPTFRTWDGQGSPVSFVASMNLHRLHLTRKQRAEVMRALRAEGATYQDIADTTGVSKDTAWRTTRDVLKSDFGFENARGQQRPPSYQPRAEPEPPAEEKPIPHVAQNSGNNEWYTPAEYIAAARAVLGTIDLDPASSATANEVIGATRFYTSEDDGLSQPWQGKVWMNPPYAQPLIEQFCVKLVASVQENLVDEAIVLVNNATETAWFQSLAEIAACICFPRSRVRFWSPDRIAAPLQGQAVLYLGLKTTQFCNTFAAFGLVVWT